MCGEFLTSSFNLNLDTRKVLPEKWSEIRNMSIQNAVSTIIVAYHCL